MDTIKRSSLQVLKHSPNDKSEVRTTAAVEDHVSPKRRQGSYPVSPVQRQDSKGVFSEFFSYEFGNIRLTWGRR